MKTIYITEAQKKKIKKAIASQDQVGGKVNAGVMDAVAYGGGMCENVENETKWNGEGEEFNLAKAKHIPSILYHASLRKNRESILANGIIAGVGEEYRDWWNYDGPNGEIPDAEDLPDVVFLSYKPNTWSDTYPLDFMDIYEIDVKSLNKNLFYLDPDRYLALKGCFCYMGNIPKNAFKLIDCVYRGKSYSINEVNENTFEGPCFETWYRGYNSKFPNMGVPKGQGIWITDEIDYAKLYADEFEEYGKIAKVVIDIRKINYMSEGDMLDLELDPYYSDEDTCRIVKENGYNSWICWYYNADAYGLCLTDTTPIVNIEDVDESEYIQENVEDDTYELGAEKGMSPYYHVNESNEEIITLYHGVNRKGLEFNLEHGGFIPRVCSEGGPKAVWLSEKQYGYEFTFAFDFPKSLVEQLSNVDYIFTDKIGFNDFNCRLVKTSISIYLDDTVVETNILDERLSKLHFRYFPDLGITLWKEFKQYPNILETYVNPFIEKYQTLQEDIKKEKSTIKESPDIVWSLGLRYGDGEAIPFMYYNRNETFYVGEDGQKHIEMMQELGISQDDVKAIQTIGGAFEQYVDAERTGRYWPSANVISFWKTPIRNKQKLISSINYLSQYVDVDIKYLVVDYWDGSKDMLIPYRWFMNGTYDMLSSLGIFDINPNNEEEYVQIKKYTSFYVVTQNNGRHNLDIDGNFIENQYTYSISENVESEIVNPDDVDLSSFNIKKKLNPKFWKDGILDSRIRMKLLDIADDFIEFLGIDWAKPEDITMTGSLANFNWDEKYSDIDLHIIMDYSDVDERTDFVSNYFYSQKKLWNDEHSNINILGFPVEVFVQDVNERHDSSGVYSLEKNKWIIEPEREKLASSKVNKSFIKDKVSEYMNAIDKLEYLFNKTKDDEYKLRRVMEKSDKLFDKIKAERKLGFEKCDGREINNYNIIFKSLRRNGYIEKLVNIKSMAYDKLKSLH